RPMLEIVELLQRRTGRPISYEDPLWAYEGTREKAGDIKRTAGFPDAANPKAPVKDIVTLTPANFDYKMVVDARSHLLAEPVDGSLGALLPALITEYNNKQLPGSYTQGYLGAVESGGYGWVVLPDKFRSREGNWIAPRRVLDYPITFPVEQRTTQATFALIVDLVSRASGQLVKFEKLESEASAGGRVTNSRPVDIPAKQFVRIGATNETARSVIAKALRTIERGDPRTQGPIPQRAWRLLYSIDKGTYYLDLVEVRQESYRVDGASTGTKPVNWPSATAPAAATSNEERP
ncbi:MAG TPA: hypothetical protein VFY29_16765, partial [Terriglobia bacterium]|nr:hypothetical protein [Terriglobia bacterium]